MKKAPIFGLQLRAARDRCHLLVGAARGRQRSRRAEPEPVSDLDVLEIRPPRAGRQSARFRSADHWKSMAYPPSRIVHSRIFIRPLASLRDRSAGHRSHARSPCRISSRTSASVSLDGGAIAAPDKHVTRTAATVVDFVDRSRQARARRTRRSRRAAPCLPRRRAPRPRAREETSEVQRAVARA